MPGALHPADDRVTQIIYFTRPDLSNWFGRSEDEISPQDWIANPWLTERISSMFPLGHLHILPVEGPQRFLTGVAGDGL